MALTANSDTSPISEAWGSGWAISHTVCFVQEESSQALCTGSLVSAGLAVLLAGFAVTLGRISIREWVVP